MTHHHWTKENLEKIHSITDYEGMLEMALNVLSQMPKPVIQVCGPLTTGGLGSLKKNLEAFEKVIDHLVASGKTVFDQLPFEIPMQKFKLNQKGKYATDLLDKFYLPLFETGFIDELYFLPDWESSLGARWEHEQAKRLGLKIVYFSKNVPDKK